MESDGSKRGGRSRDSRSGRTERRRRREEDRRKLKETPTGLRRSAPAGREPAGREPAGRGRGKASADRSPGKGSAMPISGPGPDGGPSVRGARGARNNGTAVPAIRSGAPREREILCSRPRRVKRLWGPGRTAIPERRRERDGGGPAGSRPGPLRSRPPAAPNPGSGGSGPPRRPQRMTAPAGRRPAGIFRGKREEPPGGGAGRPVAGGAGERGRWWGRGGSTGPAGSGVRPAAKTDRGDLRGRPVGKIYGEDG